MKEIRLFDAHCDTISMLLEKGGALRKNAHHIDLEQAGEYSSYAQFFALWASPDWIERFGAKRAFQMQYDRFLGELAENKDRLAHCRTMSEARGAHASGRMAAFLSVEGAELLGCDLEALRAAYDLGVRAVCLSWNTPNALCGTHREEPPRGLTPQGRQWVAEMERLGMLVDVSHMSAAGFWDVLEMAKKPVIASHSNASGRYAHTRNLTDRQFTAIINSGGVAGLNLYADFVGTKPDLSAALDHLEYFFDMGGAKHVCLGCDLDGCDELPEGIRGVEDLWRLYEGLLRRNYSQDLADDVFYRNLERVVEEGCST